MTMKRWIMASVAAVGLTTLVAWSSSNRESTAGKTMQLYVYEQDALIEVQPIQKSDAEWRKELSPERYRVLRVEGTECAFTGALEGNKKEGLYRCGGCGSDLFVSTTKFESGTGWPSFFQPVHENNIGTTVDYKMGAFYPRTEVHCARCGGHLGHVFEDGPKPTGLRYCINSAAMDFVEMPIRDKSIDP